jgi:putative serine protease PepD
MNAERDTAGYEANGTSPGWYPSYSSTPAPRPAPVEPVSAPLYPAPPADYAPPAGYGPPSGAPTGYGPPSGAPAGYGPPSGAPAGYGPPGFGPPGFGPPGFGPAPTPVPAPLSVPPPPSVPPALPGRPRRSRKVLVAVVAVLLAVVGAQAYVLIQVNQSLDKVEARLDKSNEDAKAVQARVTELENTVGRQFNPEAIAKAVVPSVFRVRAGDFIGTAFAVGKNTASGGTNLFTNFHVVESVYSGGGRQVFLERQSKRFPARIVAVDKDHDVAHLQTTSKFTGLTTAGTPVKAGQQIVVVGSPLGLEDTVTSGVVSAFREIEDLAGKVIQFDASINPGNSGGPVINSANQVVGIASAKARDAEGIGLAVPIATACGKFKIC